MLNHLSNFYLLSMPDGNELIVFCILVLIVYFLPTIIARNNIIGIFLLNLLLGWTAIGWIGALIWALMSNSNRKADINNNNLIKAIKSDHNTSQSKLIIPSKESETSFNEGLNSKNDDKDFLLSKLTQLYALKEKNVITDEIYENERQIILTKLQPIKEEKKAVIINHDESEIDTTANSNQEEIYSPSYEEVYGEKSWFQRNKTFSYFFIFIIIITGFIFWYHQSNNKSGLAEIQNNSPKTDSIGSNSSTDTSNSSTDQSNSSTDTSNSPTYQEEMGIINNIPKEKIKTINLLLNKNKIVAANKFPEGEENKDLRATAIRCLKDLDNDNIDELIIYYFTGGAHCCDVYNIFKKNSDTTYKQIFSFTGPVTINKNQITLDLYEALGYFYSCYACEIETPHPLSPEIILNIKNDKFYFGKTIDSLNQQIEENLTFLQKRGVPDFPADDSTMDDGTRKTFAENIISFYINNGRDLEKSKLLFYNNYSHSDQDKIWADIKERYLDFISIGIEKDIDIEQ